MASGRTTWDVYQDEHWDPKRRQKGKLANYVDVAFDTVLGPEPSTFMPVSAIPGNLRRKVYWRTQMSGIEIPQDALRALETAWQRFTRTDTAPSRRQPISAVENTLTEVRYYVRTRDRRLQQRAKAESNGTCEACRENFRTLLGGLGSRVLQVHHRKQLAATDKPRLTSLTDLAVVCANCHAMIHADPKRAMPVERLRRRLARARG